MSRVFHVIIFLFLAISVGAGIWVLTSDFEPSFTDQPQVSATIFPVYDITRHVADGVAETNLILPAGASPHTFEPTTQTARTIRQSQRVFGVGHGLDNWISDLLGNDPDRFITLDQDVHLISAQDQTDDHNEDEGEDGHGPVDPHYWLDIENAKVMTRTIADELVLAYPEEESRIRKNEGAYLTSLVELGNELQKIRKDIEQKEIVTLHDGWRYFARSLDLEVAATFEPSAGTEPTPQFLIELTRVVESVGVPVIYAEPQLSVSSLQSFLADNELSVATLDPIGGSTEIDSYISLMKTNAQVIANNQ